MIEKLRPSRPRTKASLTLVADAPAPVDERPFRTCDHVLDILSSFFNVSGRDLRSQSRCDVGVARVRQIGMYVVHVTLGLTMSEVGRAFGRDRSTVAHACHVIEDMREEPDFDRIIHALEAIIGAAFGQDGSERR
ncbi:MAG: helix-turn-helix domain-containing protein [Alphaproteobacteria bacterium]